MATPPLGGADVTVLISNFSPRLAAAVLHAASVATALLLAGQTQANARGAPSSVASTKVGVEMPELQLLGSTEAVGGDMTGPTEMVGATAGDGAGVGSRLFGWGVGEPGAVHAPQDTGHALL